jgi:hypothetical protein
MIQVLGAGCWVVQLQLALEARVAEQRARQTGIRWTSRVVARVRVAEIALAANVHR